MKASRILAGLSATAIAASLVSMVSVSADVEYKAEATDITSVVVNATVTGGNALFTNQFTDWSGKVVTMTEGTADYDVSPDAAVGGFTNLGFVNSATAKKDDGNAADLEDGIVVTINSLTVNDYVFSGEDINVDLIGVTNENGLMNQWFGDNGHDIISDDGTAKITFSGSGLTLNEAVQAAEEKTPILTQFGVQGYEMDATNWAWKSTDAYSDEAGNISLTYNYADLIKDLDTTAVDVGNAGIQFVYGDEGLTKDDVVTANIAYTVKDASGNEILNDTLAYEKKWDPEARNWAVTDETAPGAFGAFADNGQIQLKDVSWNDLIGYGEITVTATVTDAKIDTIETPSENPDDKNEFAQFGVQGYEQDGTTWAWNSVDTKAASDGTLSLTYNYADLTKDLDLANVTLSAAGIQFFYGDDGLTETDTVDANIAYKVVDASGNELMNDTLAYHKEWDKTARNWAVADETAPGAYGAFVDNGTINFADATWDSLLAFGDVTVTATISDVKFGTVEAEVPDKTEYQLPQTIDTSAEEFSDWGGQGSVELKYFKNITPDTPMDVTLKVALEPGYDYYLLGPSDMNGWTRVYSEDPDGAAWKLNSITGLPLKSAMTADELAAHETDVGTPIMQNDGYIILYPAGGTEQTVTYTLSAGVVAKLMETAEENGGWGGLMHQTYGVHVNEVTLAEHSTATVTCPCGCGCTPEDSSWDATINACGCGCAEVTTEGFKAPEFDAELKFADGSWSVNTMADEFAGVAPVTAHIKGDGTYTMSLDVADLYKDFEVAPAEQFKGATVLAIDVPEVYEEGEDGEKLYPDFGMEIDSIKIDGKEISINKDAIKNHPEGAVTVDSKGREQSNALVGHIEPDGTNYRVDIYNTYNLSGKIDDPIIKAEDITEGSKLDIDFTVSGIGVATNDGYRGGCTCGAAPIEPSDSSTPDVSEPDDSSAPDFNWGYDDMYADLKSIVEHNTDATVKIKLEATGKDHFDEYAPIQFYVDGKNYFSKDVKPNITTDEGDAKVLNLSELRKKVTVEGKDSKDLTIAELVDAYLNDKNIADKDKEFILYDDENNYCFYAISATNSKVKFGFQLDSAAVKDIVKNNSSVTFSGTLNDTYSIEVVNPGIKNEPDDTAKKGPHGTMSSSSSADSSSSSSSSVAAAGNNAATNADTNPSTGRAASLALIGMLLAGAAMVASKKEK